MHANYDFASICLVIIGVAVGLLLFASFMTGAVDMYLRLTRAENTGCLIYLIVGLVLVPGVSWAILIIWCIFFGAIIIYVNLTQPN